MGRAVPYPRADAIIKKDTSLTASVIEFLASFQIGQNPAAPAAVPDSGRFHANILLAEDCSITHRLISRYLHVAGAEVVVVENGVQAVSVASEQPFDLILMDIEMPEMDGIEATRRLRENGFRAPIVAVTAHDPGRASAEGGGGQL